jgi:hypothetical protein
MRAPSITLAGALALAGTTLVALPAQAVTMPPVTCQYWVGPQYTLPPARNVNQEVWVGGSGRASLTYTYLPTGRSWVRGLRLSDATGTYLSALNVGHLADTRNPPLAAFTAADISVVTSKGVVCTPTDIKPV